ncbi:MULTISPECIES: hypothetical protein [Yersinia]|uniref:Levan regulatory protein n=2 Tax=Yersinia bercovieri TaxID=634 RepID=A0A2G4U5E1_YERBE|nr:MULTISPECIES: hypothetical protein [Yersinia]EEQ06170.1 hypothetical protein yberc0001_26470 [Yersinia bercovieri ATCC 43970]MDN0102228.1 hypothetical protein [Yersinia bercovieri]PHZ28517.1 hypothetical protein CS533_04265 [Yersinia bercovieri]QDW32960.1 hypothetical protein FFE93_007730 [Yersinia sp. KBS0713]QKJ08691.1 hypothetical protein HRK25_18470 [Yersinia bercovieri ATCC 43970]
MTDLFFESLALDRIDLVARLVTSSNCQEEDRELALFWIAEMTAALIDELNKIEKNSYQNHLTDS